MPWKMHEPAAFMAPPQPFTGHYTHTDTQTVLSDVSPIVQSLFNFYFSEAFIWADNLNSFIQVQTVNKLKIGLQQTDLLQQVYYKRNFCIQINYQSLQWYHKWHDTAWTDNSLCLYLFYGR